MSKQPNLHQPTEIFYSYSHRDEKLRDELEKHLSILKRQGVISEWHDRKIGAGKEWQGQIDMHLNTARIILLLISPDFLASDYCYDIELKRAIERHEAGKALVIPVILRPCDWKGAPFGNLQALPKDAKPVTRWQNRDEAFENIAKGIRATVEESSRISRSSTSSSSQIVDSGLALKISNFKVPDVVPEFIFVSKDSPPLTIPDLQCEYEDITIPLPAELEVIKHDYIKRKEKEASQRNQTLNNNKSYSLYSIRIDREQDELGHRHRVFRCLLRPTDYFSGVVFPNLALDEIIEVRGAKTTPRQVLGLTRDKIRFETLSDYCCHFPLFTATVFITSDNKVVIPIRSRRQFVAGGDTYHLSAAEGMLRPIDIYEGNGAPSPFLTAIRSLEDELGLKRGVDFTVDDIRCLGLLLDTFRAHPFCIFYLRSSQIRFDDVKRKWLQAKDRFEAKDILGMDWSESTARKLVEGSFEYQGDSIRVASNHAQSGWILASLFEFGELSLQE